MAIKLRLKILGYRLAQWREKVYCGSGRGKNDKIIFNWKYRKSTMDRKYILA